MPMHADCLGESALNFYLQTMGISFSSVVMQILSATGFSQFLSIFKHRAGHPWWTHFIRMIAFYTQRYRHIVIYGKICLFTDRN